MISYSDLIKELDKYKFKQLHIHHTWRPNHNNFNGKNHIALQSSMRNYHINSNHWSDIGQHITVFPDGNIVTGRPFNVNPASITGWNDKAFCIEMLGDFDKGNDKLIGEQKNTILKLTKYFIDKYGEGSVKFHNENSSKTCPGTSINKVEFIMEAKSLNKTVVSPVVNSSIPSDWAKESWEWCKGKGYMDGNRPLDGITRQEVALIIYRVFTDISGKK